MIYYRLLNNPTHRFIRHIPVLNLLTIHSHLSHFSRIAHVLNQGSAVGAGIFLLYLVIDAPAKTVGSLFAETGFCIVIAGTQKLQFILGEVYFACVGGI